ncbi:hypothetical protein SEA_WEASELS2_224 [Rhodococcus phage Weasels2]|uniref:Uncharacterized protein n=1 Tax=Rhodococcus phage Weasels2 TaxID=1897437 RepID=A0A1I9SAJ6_9CAUD|nr:hypothetical protein FDH04_gp192 [Rhodococcus phage Weasels2]AOZ63802.1 hypothetical protein SEA_WEASELS2_224 [Rhodococcus phage Weasels2]
MKLYTSINDGVQNAFKDFQATSKEEVAALLYKYVVEKRYDVRTPAATNSSSWHEIWLTKGTVGVSLVIDFEEPEEDD